MATFDGSFNLSSFTSKAGTCTTECTFPSSFFVMSHAVYILLLDLAMKSIVVLFLCFFYNFP
jgi:hypothetical protein